MKYTLVLGVGYDDSNWNLETFSKERKVFLSEIVEKYKTFKGHYIDNLERVEFLNSTPELEKLLRKECESRNLIFDIGTNVTFSEKDFKEAQFVPFLASGEEVDFDGCNELNTYKEVLCEHCGRTNDSSVPNPYDIFNKRIKHPHDIFNAMNGIRIISILAFELLREEIEPWINFGQVRIVDKKKRPVKTDYEYVWIRPKIEVGPFVNAKVKKRCDKCQQPTEIRREYSNNTFEYEWVVESFKDTGAPIVLAGNWFGEVSQEETSNHARDVFISADLHERIRKMNLKGFVKADYVICSADDVET